ncbi:SusC/RagA family TonB-linked outer membrane protein [Paraflavisolibacter sp. H34]|uniref:SusC/RagA family TonB-linked outer membrane protein n=1 Tax=Huijunlia imazamoxiresistens TaxID=3127457 RepID=UPI00301B22F3
MSKSLIKTTLASALVLATGLLQAQAPALGQAPASSPAAAPARRISGQVTDAASKNGIAGIRVQVEGYSAAITDKDGNFSLKVPSLTTTLVLEGEGYGPRRVALKGRSRIQESLFDDSHESFYSPLVLPGSIVPRSNVAASVGSYNAASAWGQPGETVDALLQGRVAGLNAVRRSGTPGAGANLFLRGYNSLYGTNQPLLVIDNMIFDAGEYGESIVAGAAVNPLALIDVKDIDNVTVLRDATAQYGTKGANGAIIITTARAKSQATKIDFALYSTFNQVPKNLPVLDAADYRVYLSEQLQSRGWTPAQVAAQPYMDDRAESNQYPAYHFQTDWQQRVLENSLNRNVYLKITGGDNIATYGLSLGYTGNKGIVRHTDLTRYNTRFNAEFNFTKRFTGLANLSFAYNEQNLKDAGMAEKTAPLYLALVKAPFLGTNEVNDKGVLSPNLADVDTLGLTNPAVIIDKMKAENKYYRFFGSFAFKYELSKYLHASTLAGVTYDKVRENSFIPRRGVTNDTAANAILDSRMATQVRRLFSLFSDTRLEYNRLYRLRHHISARAGLRYQDNDAARHYARGFNSATDDLESVQTGVALLRQVGGSLGRWNWLNAYLGADYGFNQKLFLSLNAALDGSSRFGTQAEGGLPIAGRKWPLMAGAGVAWLLSSEAFMGGSPLDLLKLRASVSLTGNDDIGNYSYRRTYTSQNLLGAQGLVRSGIADPALQWETVRKFNAGLDLSFWNQRVNLSMDAFHHQTDNLLVYGPLAPVTGFSTGLTNGGRLQNAGGEVTASVRLVNRPSLKWDAGLNISAYKNKVLAVPGGRFTTDYAGATLLTAEGKGASLFYGYQADGVYASEAEAAAAPTYSRSQTGELLPFGAGDVRFVNRADAPGDTLANGTRVAVIDAADRTVIGNPAPAVTGGFHNHLIWKRFELDALFTFSQGGAVYNYLRSRLERMSGTENQLQTVRNRWRYDGQETSVPKASWGDPLGNGRFSDRWIEDGSYLRLRTLSLQYHLPLKGGAVFKNATVYATANNLFTLTRYKGYDPEFSAGRSVFAQGIDTGLDPLFRSFTLGARIGL